MKKTLKARSDEALCSLYASTQSNLEVGLMTGAAQQIIKQTAQVLVRTTKVGYFQTTAPMKSSLSVCESNMQRCWKERHPE